MDEPWSPDNRAGLRGWLILRSFAVLATAGCSKSATMPGGPAYEELTLAPDDRIMVLAPHPDDEALGCGGIIRRALEMGLPVRVVFLTYGDNNQWSFAVYRKHLVLVPGAVRRMGLIRHDEALNAAKALGLAPEHLFFLGYPDFGTLNLWYAHWREQPAFESMLTRVREVPYPNAYRPGAPYKGEEVLRDLTTLLREFRPTRVFLSHPADHHFDHRSLYLFARVALWNLEDEIRPTTHPYLVHFRRWPTRKGYRPDEAPRPPDFFAGEIRWQLFPLTPAEVAAKHGAIQQHKTQYEYASKYLLSFVRNAELFGDFPAVRLAPGDESLQDLALGEMDVASDGGPPEQLTDEERAAFVGVEWRGARIQGSTLVLTIELSRPLAEAVSVSLYAFGYRRDVPFENMPKIHIKFSALTHEVLDQAHVLPRDSITVERDRKTITVRVPLAVLRMPGKILTSAHTYLTEVPLDWVSWRVLELAGPGPGPLRVQ